MNKSLTTFLGTLSLFLLLAMSVSFEMVGGDDPASSHRHKVLIGVPFSGAIEGWNRSEPDSLWGYVYDAVGDTVITGFVGIVIVDGFPGFPRTQVPVQPNGFWGININPATSVPEWPDYPEDIPVSNPKPGGHGCSVSITSAPTYSNPTFAMDRTPTEGLVELISADGSCFNRYSEPVTVDGVTQHNLPTRSSTVSTCVGDHVVPTQEDYNELSNNESLFYITLEWDLAGRAWKSQVDTLHIGNSDKLTYFIHAGTDPEVAELIRNSPNCIRCVNPYWNGREPVEVYTVEEAEARLHPDSGDFRVLDIDINWSSGTYGILNSIDMAFPNSVGSIENPGAWKKEILEVGPGNPGSYEGEPTPFSVGQYVFMIEGINAAQRFNGFYPNDLYQPFE